MNYECSECSGYVCGGHYIEEHARMKHPGKMVAFTPWDMDLYECEMEIQKEFSVMLPWVNP